MGFLLKEALKMLCSVNQWSYAVFWKIGCRNPKLLIWEEYHYEPITPVLPEMESPDLLIKEWEGSWVSPEILTSQLRVQAADKVHSLIVKMMTSNQIHVVGEGIIGRAAFTGNHQWILLENYIRDVHPTEVSNEIRRQFSAGMQTLAIVPVLPHGVVQLASSLPIMENLSFVNDVKSLILQLGCIPSALLANDLSTKESVSQNTSGNFKDPDHNAFITDSYNLQCNSSQLSRLVETPSLTQSMGNYHHDDHFQAKVNPVTKRNVPFRSQLGAGVTGAEVIPSNPDAWLIRQACDQSNGSYNSLGFMEPQQPGKNKVPIVERTESTRGGNCHLKAVSTAPSLPIPYAQLASIGLQHSESSQPNPHQLVSRNAWHEDVCTRAPSGDDLFDILGVDFKNKLLNANCDDFLSGGSDPNAHNLSDLSFYSISEEISDSGVFSGSVSDHLLDAVVSKVHSRSKQVTDDNVSCRTTLSKPSNSLGPSRVGMSDQIRGEFLGVPKPVAKLDNMGSTSFRSSCSKENSGNCSQSSSIYGSQMSSWVEQGKRDTSVSTGHSKRPDENSKSNRKRLKPGENPRPRPKDRQMIQDRVKELREIVPNGAKCSIDALLERTIKHMLFLQSVTKHADKLKQTGESKITSKEGGLLLKDNFEGGATWAFEVGSQSMVCPIIVEDLNPPRQMLVEMLCEERGFFLEIADIIRGMGLTILKGVMEARNDKIWARFAVEANRDVTRMEIFISLVRLLEQTMNGGASSSVPGMDGDAMISPHSFHPTASIPATGLPQ